MALFNYASKEVTLKIVYYGPGLSGKTTNLQQLHSALDSSKTGKLLSLATETDRTLFFDFLPVEFGKIKDFIIRFQLYTVPGQVKYNATRKLVLKGADAIIFVADSQKELREANRESLANMRENLLSNNINPDDISTVLQYNKRDLSNLLTIDELNQDLNIANHVYIEAVAINNKGVQETFDTTIDLLIKDISRKYKLELEPAMPTEEQVSPDKKYSEGKSPLEEMVYPTLSLQEHLPEQREAQAESVFKEPETFSTEKFDDIIRSLQEINQLLLTIKTANKGFSEELRKIKEEQKETLSIVREMTEIVENIKGKERKKWFSWK